MSRLEERYRRLLRLLPAWYRERREDEMVGTFMADREDELDLEYGWPGWGEAWAVAVLAVRSRLAAPGGPPRAVAVGDAVRLVALLGVVAYAAISVAGLVRAWLHSMVGIQVAVDAWVSMASITLVAGGAAVALVLGRCAVAKLLAVVGLGYAMYTLVPYGVPWVLVLMDLPLIITVACLFAGFHNEAPAPGRGWPRALGGAVVVAVAWMVLLTSPTLDHWRTVAPTGYLEPPALSWWLRLLTVVDPILLLLPLAVVLAAVIVARAARASVSWAIALVVAALALLPQQVVRLNSSASPSGGAVVVMSAVLAGGLVLTAVVMAAVARRGVRRLPDPTHPGLPA